MNIWRWAAFFVVVLSFEYATATVPFLTKRHPFGVKKPDIQYDRGESDSSIGDNGSSSGYRYNRRVTEKITKIIEKIKYQQHDEIRVSDYPVGGYKLSGGKLKKFNQFRMDKCSYVLKDNYAEISLRITFQKLSLHYGVSKIKSPLRGLGSFISRVIKDVTNFVLDLVIPDLAVTIILRQNFDSEVRLVVKDVIVPTNIYFSFLGGIFSKHRDTCEPYVRKMWTDTLRYQFQTTLRSSFKSECSKVTIEKSIFFDSGVTREYNGSKDQSVYGRNSGGTRVYDDDSDDEDNKNNRNRVNENEQYSDDDTDGSENGDGSDIRNINYTDGGSETRSSRRSTEYSSSYYDDDDYYDDEGGDEDDDDGDDSYD